MARPVKNQTGPSDRNIFLHPASDSYNQSGESSVLTHSPICCPTDPHKQLLCSRQRADCQQNLPVTNRTLKGNSGGIYDLFCERAWYHGCMCVCASSYLDVARDTAEDRSSNAWLSAFTRLHLPYFPSRIFFFFLPSTSQFPPSLSFPVT